jgi:hypothetical protein
VQIDEPSSDRKILNQHAETAVVKHTEDSKTKKTPGNFMGVKKGK